MNGIISIIRTRLYFLCLYRENINGSKIKVYMYTKYAFGGRFADATTTGTIKNYSV